MADETLISKLVDLVGDITKLGGQRERTTIVPNILVVDATPSDLPTGYIKIRNPRDGTNVPCLTVNGLIVADNDSVNVLFTEGTEPIALTQGSRSPSSNIKVYQLWESDFGAVAWETDASGHLLNTDGERIFIRDSTPTTRIRLDPATPSTNSFIEIYNQSGQLRFSMDSSGDLLGYDNLGSLRIQVDTGTATAESVWVLGDENEVAKILLKSGLSTTKPVVGIGTSTIPHGGIGAAMMALDGANASLSGPHIQVTTATDNYPLWQWLHWTHDNITLSFDAYYDGSFRSSDVGSNYQIRKLADALDFNYGSGVAQGSIVTFATGLRLNTSGNVQVANDVFNLIDTNRLGLSGGNSLNNGANIELYGGTHATLANRAFYDSSLHQFRSQDGSSTKLTIDHANNVSRFFHRVGIGASPATSALLELSSTTGALLLSRMTTTQRDALTAVDGMILYNTTTGKIEGREGGAWVDI